jgi:murein L,D-transpeptidase YafK
MPMPSARSGALLLVALCLAAPVAAGEMPRADRIIVLKSKRLLLLERGGVVLKSYPIALGRRPVGGKRRRGDGRTPEGVYFIDGRNPGSVYHRSLHLSYPSEADLARARAAGLNPGEDIVIHGMPEWYGHADPVRFFRDWTDGCISVGNTAIEEIWDAAPDGIQVEIRP